MSDGPPSPSLARGGAALWVASTLGNGLAYGFTAVVARSFGPAQYGALGALLGAALIGAIPAGALQYVLARRTAAGHLERDHNEPAGLRLSVRVGTALAALVAALSPVEAGFFHLQSGWPVLLLAATPPPRTIR